MIRKFSDVFLKQVLNWYFSISATSKLESDTQLGKNKIRITRMIFDINLIVGLFLEIKSISS